MADDTDGEWLTYAEAAERLRIKVDSVKRRAASRKWARRRGNDGLARVLIPRDVIPDNLPAPAPEITPESTPEENGIVARLAVAEARLSDAQNALSSMREDRDRWQSMAAALRADLAAERSASRSWLDRIFRR